jgi:hypothetical protein
MPWADWHTLRSILRMSNRAETRPEHPSVDLRTRFLVMDPPEADGHVRTCIERLGNRWQLVEAAVGGGVFQLTRRTALRFYIDDVKVTLWPAEDSDPPRVGVDLLSTSRLGRCDFGQNARNIRDFYRSLEAYLRHVPEPSIEQGATFDV